MHAVTTALRSCLRQQTTSLVQAAWSSRSRTAVQMTTTTAMHAASASGVLLTSSCVFSSSSGDSAASLTTTRRYGSGVSRKTRSNSGKSSGKGQRASAHTGKRAAAAATGFLVSATASGVSITTAAAAAGAATKNRAAFDDEEQQQPQRHGEWGECDDVSDEEAELVSPLTRRARRGSKRRSGSGAVGAMNSREAEEQEKEEAIMMETPAEDPTAPAQDDDDDETDVDGGTGIHESDETRVDGVEEEASDSATDDADELDKAEMAEEGLPAAEEEGDKTASSHDSTGGTSPFAIAEQDAEVANKFLAVAFPELAAEYSAAGPQANAVPVDEVKVDSAEVAAWRCPRCTRTWRCGIFVRCILKNECPHCAAEHRVTMATVRPDLLQLWDHNRNDPFLKPAEVEASSKAVVYWICPTCRESYTARVRDRVTDKAQCPSCALLRSTSADALGAEASVVQQEWHPLKNGDLRLDQLSPTDRKTKVWWLCAACGHEWETSLASRLSRRRHKGGVCPACHGKGVAEVF
ncbi:putative Zinc-ribbon domain containing protein [Lotmaria passim]